jgi:thiol-disulfide isomerase/thioredoxin
VIAKSSFLRVLPVSVLLLGVLGTLSACSRKTPRPQPEPTAAPDASAQPVATPLGTAAAAASPPSSVSAETDLGSSIVELTGSEIVERLRTTQAKFTLLNFWASWCGPCRREFPMLLGLAENMRAQGVEVLFVSLDEPESFPVAIDFATRNGLALPIIVAKRPIGALKAAVHPGWPGMLPATFLFDATGKLQHFWGGPVYEHELLPIIEQALVGQLVPGETRFGLSAGKDMRNE